MNNKVFAGTFYLIGLVFIYFIFMHDSRFEWPIFIFFFLMGLPAIITIISGLRDDIVSAKINKNGEERYGYVAYVRKDLDGTEIDGQTDLELKVDVYFEEYDDSRYYYDKVQFNDEGFTGKKFVKVKMLNGEINVINEIVDLDNVPLNIKNGLLRLKDKNFLNIKDLDENTIEVNGKKYIRVD